MRSVVNSDDTYMSKTTGKISALWICRLLFFGCFFVAIFVANTIWKNEAAWIGYLHESSFVDWTGTLEADGSNLIYVLLARLPIWMVLMVFGRTLFGLLIGQGFLAWQGFASGFILSAFLIRYGVVGIVVFFLTCMPQIILYVIAYWLLYHIICKQYRQKRQTIVLGEEYSEPKKTMGSYVGACFVLTTVLLVGIFLESYVNVLLLNKIARILTVI